MRKLNSPSFQSSKNDSNSKHSIIVMEAVAAGSSALGQRILGCALNSVYDSRLGGFALKDLDAFKP